MWKENGGNGDDPPGNGGGSNGPGGDYNGPEGDGSSPTKIVVLYFAFFSFSVF